MANQAFALSPISARASLPSEEDYDAIREAFMETARGRWFLDEYARRNRNADTRMVLDAVSRIEETLVAQRQPQPPPPEFPFPLHPPPPLHPGTREPVTPDLMFALFPEALVAQEMSSERTIDIPQEVREHLLGPHNPPCF